VGGRRLGLKIEVVFKEAEKLSWGCDCMNVCTHVYLYVM
jgi:hypothetical protein